MADRIKIKKPIWKRWWVWVAAVFVIIIIASDGNEEKKATQPEQQLSQEQTQPEIKDQEKIKEHTIGFSDEETIMAMEITLKNYGLHDIDMQIADGRDKGGARVLILSYKSSASTSIKLAEESGAILGCYTTGLKNGWDVDELSVVVGDTQGNAVGMWYCSKEWTDDYINGKISMEELSAKVLTTF